MIENCDVKKLYNMLGDGGEIALIDVREVIPYGYGHILWSVNVALSRLELDFTRLVPRRTTRVVLLDSGEGLAERAAALLDVFGYSHLFLLDSGIKAWADAGYILHKETKVAVKGFAAFAELHGQPRFIEPAALKAHLERGDEWIVLDSRTLVEYRAGNIPGSINAPGPAALRSYYDLVPSSTTNVVVNCASRTRGILGALTLQAAGVPNEVYVLQDGTLGWLLEGLALEVGADRAAMPPSPKARDKARQSIHNLVNKAEIPRANVADMMIWQNETERTTYLFDVRDPLEYQRGHIAGALNAPAIELIMSYEKHFGTLNSRVVLTDDDGIRAGVTALWLAQIGACQPFLLEGKLVVSTSTQDPTTQDEALGTSFDLMNAQVLATLLTQEAVLLLDLGSSNQYRLGHIPGAVWVLRSELDHKLPDAIEMSHEQIVLTAEDSHLAAFALMDVKKACGLPVRLLQGGNPAWRIAGYSLVSEPEYLLSEPLDHWLTTRERENPRQAMRDYLIWETSLLSLIEANRPFRYRNLLW